MRKWIDSVPIVMFVGFFLMVGCCSVALHYRTQSLAPLYNFGIILAVAVCVYGLAVISCAAITTNRTVTLRDVGGLFVALLVIWLCLSVFASNSVTALHIGGVVALAWLLCICVRVGGIKDEDNEDEE
jgi:FtsH-binding integral membrane protein